MLIVQKKNTYLDKKKNGGGGHAPSSTTCIRLWNGHVISLCALYDNLHDGGKDDMAPMRQTIYSSAAGK